MTPQLEQAVFVPVGSISWKAVAYENLTSGLELSQSAMSREDEYAIERVNAVVKACKFHDQLVDVLQKVIDAEKSIEIDKDYAGAVQNRIDVHLAIESLLREI
jgi:hypothetical protein